MNFLKVLRTVVLRENSGHLRIKQIAKFTVQCIPSE